MEHLWAPWRIEYVKKAKEEGCVFCEKPQEADDRSNLILYRGKFNFIILNAYPYNPGHIMVAPNRHIGDLDFFEDDEIKEHADLVRLGISILKKAFHPDGFNIGMNIGRVAGAGVEGHLHTHIVPRWSGDNNFMPVISDTRVVNQALLDTYNRLASEIAANQQNSQSSC